MNSFKDARVFSDIPRRGETETSNEASGKVGEDVTVPAIQPGQQASRSIYL